MAKNNFSQLRDSRWERGYRAGMVSVKGDDGVVTNYNPRDLEILQTPERKPKSDSHWMSKWKERNQLKASTA